MELVKATAAASVIKDEPEEDKRCKNENAVDRKRCLEETKGDEQMQKDEGLQLIEKCSIEIVKEVFDRWCVIGITEALSSDTDIASFLIQQYEKMRNGGQQAASCVKCNVPLPLTCARCMQSRQQEGDRTVKQQCLKPAFVKPRKKFRSLEQLLKDNLPKQTASAKGVDHVKIETSLNDFSTGDEQRTAELRILNFESENVSVSFKDCAGESRSQVGSSFSPTQQMNEVSHQPKFKSGAKQRSRKQKSKPVKKQLQDEDSHNREQVAQQATSIPEIDYGKGIFQVQPVMIYTDNADEVEYKPSLEFLDSHACEKVAGSIGSVESNQIWPSFDASLHTSDESISHLDLQSCANRKRRKRKAGSSEELLEGDIRPHKCELCPAAFSRHSNLFAHLVRHGEKPHKCKHCSASFRKYAELQAHDREVHKDFGCKVCGITFQHGYKLAEHMRRHSGEKPYTCDICGMGFIAAAQRNMHRRIHTGERPYMCTTCGKAFARSGTLLVHERTHLVVKPHTCTECGRAFKERIQLQIHLRTHSGIKPFQCELCGKAMAHKSTLKYHMRTHTGQKPYTCPVCGKAFTTCSNMWQHRRTHKT